MRGLKWIFGLLGIALAVLLLGLWAAFHFFPPERLRAMAATELGRRTNRQAEIGPFHLGVSGLAIDHLRLSEVPDFLAGTAIDAKGVRLGWDLHSLWEGLNLKGKSITRSRGRFHIDELHNPHYSAQDFSLTWSLSGIDSTCTHLQGWAHLEQGPGILENIDRLVAANPPAKLALAPVTALMNMEITGALNLGLPNFKHWPIDSIRGDYAFGDGFMDVQRFDITSPALNMAAEGTVQLVGGKLSAEVRLTSPARASREALDAKVHISGTLSHPIVDLESLKKKAFKATISKLLGGRPLADSDVDALLKKLLR